MRPSNASSVESKHRLTDVWSRGTPRGARRHVRFDDALHALASACLFLASCATGARGLPGPTWQNTPASAAPSAPPAESPASAEAGADADFQAAVTRLNQGDRTGGVAALDAFVAAHPRSPARAVAVALLARAALAAGDESRARTLLRAETGVEDEPALRFVAGLVAARRGQPDRARTLLQPFLASGPPSLAGANRDEAALELYAALGEASTSANDDTAALDAWARYFELGSPAERTYALERAQAVAARVEPTTALDLLGKLHRGASPLVRIVLAPRAALALAARGQNDDARRLTEEAEELRRGAKLESDASPPPDVTVAEADPTRIGLGVPMTGRAAALGTAVTRAAMVALGDAPPLEAEAGRPRAFQVVVRDTQDASKAPGASVLELAQAEAVLGIVGTPDPTSAASLGRAGVPFLVLEDEPLVGAPTAFPLLHGPDARATALVTRATAAGVRTFAVLAPENAGGRRLTEAFRRAVTAAGGNVVGEVHYPAGATTFVKPVRELQKLSFDALFIPEDADRLELIAPALAFADLWSRPAAEVGPGKRKASAPGAKPTRGLLLLSTARGLSPRLLENAGRYVQGALLAPGFYADPEGASGKRLIGRWKELFGVPPGAAEAYAYDGVRLLAWLAERGARTRGDVLRRLGSDEFEGATGRVRFGADHTRADAPAVYEVVGDEIRALR